MCLRKVLFKKIFLLNVPCSAVTFMTSKKIWWYAVCAKEYREAGSLPLYASQGNHEYVDGKKESGK